MRIRWLGLIFCLGIGLLHAAESAVAKRVALVFDDGPRPADVEALLAVLAREDVHVTFALVGDRVNESPAAAKMIVAAGHEVVNHSQTHAHPRKLDDAALEHEVLAAQEKITAAAGRAPHWYWLPFIEYDPRLEAITAKAGIKVYPIKQLVVSMDYDTSVPAPEIYRRATTDVRDGAVILCHEWRKETREQLPAILAELRRQGCVFFTFSTLQEALGHDAGKAKPDPSTGTTSALESTSDSSGEFLAVF